MYTVLRVSNHIYYLLKNSVPTKVAFTCYKGNWKIFDEFNLCEVNKELKKEAERNLIYIKYALVS